MIKKPINANYLQDVPEHHKPVNEQNRKYIDRFVTENYERLNSKFKTDEKINSSGFGALDKLNETLQGFILIRIYALRTGRMQNGICRASSLKKNYASRFGNQREGMKWRINLKQYRNE